MFNLVLALLAGVVTVAANTSKWTALLRGCSTPPVERFPAKLGGTIIQAASPEPKIRAFLISAPRIT
jgi:hypothetical protein